MVILTAAACNIFCCGATSLEGIGHLNNHNRQISMPSAGFEPAIPASELPQTHALDRAATGIGRAVIFYPKP